MSRPCRPIASAAFLSLALFAEAAWAMDPERPLGECPVDIWRARDGLPGAWIRAITQTPDGYLWIGTQGGLVRYGGGPLVPLAPLAATERGRDVMGLAVAGPGTLWLISPRGLPLCAQDARLTECVRNAAGAAALKPDSRIADLSADAAGVIWIAAPEGLFRVDQGQLVLVRAPAAWGSGPPTAVHHDGRGRLWVGTSQGLYAGPSAGPATGPLTQVAIAGAPFTEPIADIATGARGVIWVAGERTLVRLEGERQQHFGPRDGLPEGRLTVVMADRDGNLWVGSREGLVRFREGRGFVRFTRSDGLPDDDVSALFEDREGSLWVGTRSGGLAQFSDRTLDRRSGPPGPRSQWVSSVAEDDEGALWTGTGRGLTRWKDGQEQTFTSADGLPSDGVLSVRPAGSTLWVGTNRGLARRRQRQGPSDDRFEAVPEVSAAVTAMNVHRQDGALWAGTAEGLVRLSGGTVARYPLPPGMLGPDGGEIRAIEWDDQGVLWSSANGTLLRLEGDKLARVADPAVGALPAAPGQPGQPGTPGQPGKIRSIARDAAGTLWLGTGDGLLRRRQGQWRLFGGAEGVERTDLFQVALDDRGFLWVGVNHGLLRFAIADFEAIDQGKRRAAAPLSFEILDELREVRITRTRQPGVWKDRAGRLRFATSRGVVTVDPARLPLNPLPPPVRIERALVDGRPAERGGPNRFPPGSGAMEFHFAAITLLEPRRAQHRYRLEGFDEDWVEAGTRRAAYYTNLGPGRYRFRVQGSNADGVWNEAGDALELTLAPHFYQTVWFYGLAALAALGLALSFHGARVARLRARYTATLAERARVARELHDSLLQGMAAALMHLRGVRKRFGNNPVPAEPATVARELKEIEELVSDNIEDTRQFVWDLREHAQEMPELPPALTELTAKLVPPGSLEAKVVVEGEPQPVPRHVQRELLRIAHEAVVNAVRHGQARHLETRLSYEPSAVSLSVRDDGRGFDPQGVAEAKPGHFGLTGMRERAARLGQLIIESAAGQGTTIKVNVALKDLRDA